MMYIYCKKKINNKKWFLSLFLNKVHGMLNISQNLLHFTCRDVHVPLMLYAFFEWQWPSGLL